MDAAEQLTRHFTAGPFRCPCGRCTGFGDEETQDELRQTAQWLEEVRLLLGETPLLVLSGYRCRPLLGLHEGLAAEAFHAMGRAVDLVAPDLSPRTVQTLLKQQRRLAVGLLGARGFTHIDRRDGPPLTYRYTPPRPGAD